MCAHADLPKSLWAKAASIACYVYNRLPNAPLKCKSPHEVWYSRKPDLSNLRVFGCVAYALVPAAKRKKFDNRMEKMRFLGYHKGHRGYKLMERGSKADLSARFKMKDLGQLRYCLGIVCGDLYQSEALH